MNLINDDPATILRSQFKEDDAMDHYLLVLRRKREAVQATIDAEYARPHPDGIFLRDLKKAKLQLREHIEQLERIRQPPAFRAGTVTERRA
jgi:hypothetical protein